jgi:4-amino-4-deoxy-L-arabinose transferase-like glycosyltransferase
MKFTEEDREIIERIKRNAPFLIKGTLASLPFFFLSLACMVTGSIISGMLFCLAQAFTLLAFHREQKWSKKKSFLVVACCFFLGILFLN